jgi:methylated-DNA-[protein]-cysteine S-methyltransferase
MTRPALELRVDRVASPLGSVVLVWDGDARLRALDFAGCEARMLRLLELHHRASRLRLTEGPAPRGLVAGIAAFFGGDVGAITAIPIAPGGTPFQRAVWAALREIPIGTTTTYGQLAAAIGRPTASRAVGAANGANPIAIVVPCHRVIGADGSLTGYGGGLERKRWLLAHERRHAPPARSAALRIVSRTRRARPRRSRPARRR